MWGNYVKYTLRSILCRFFANLTSILYQKAITKSVFFNINYSPPTHWLNDNFKSRDGSASKKKAKTKNCSYLWFSTRFLSSQEVPLGWAAGSQLPEASSIFSTCVGDRGDRGLDFEDNHNKVENILRIIAMALKTLRIIAMIFQTTIVVVDNLISSSNLTVLLLLAPRRWLVIVML